MITGVKYYYRVTTGNAISGIRSLRTPNNPALELPFRFAAYSDSQIDGGNPTKHFEIVNDGIISYVNNLYGPNIWDELDFVMIPGDLVSNGNTHSNWTDHFFGQAANLYRHVPLYPVLGNHEVNSQLYFNYFNLPENGTPGFLEPAIERGQDVVELCSQYLQVDESRRKTTDLLDPTRLSRLNTMALAVAYMAGDSAGQAFKIQLDRLSNFQPVK